MSTAPVQAATFTGGSPLFFVDDVARTCEWYRDHLGFEIGEYFREDHGPHDDDPNHPDLGEPIYAIINRDGQRLMFKRSPERGAGVRSNHDIEASSCDMYFWVEGVEELHESVEASGATFIHGLIVQPYGLAEFAILDCDGRMVRLGGPPAG